MKAHQALPVAEVARQLRQYKAGERVKVIRGELLGKVFTVREYTNDYLIFVERPKRDVMSKRAVEPEDGFTDEEINQARRAAEKLQEKGSHL